MFSLWETSDLWERVPQVFRARVKERRLDESAYNPDMDNYASAELSGDQLEAHFRKEEALGRMIPSTEAAIAEEFGPNKLLTCPMALMFQMRHLGLPTIANRGSQKLSCLYEASFPQMDLDRVAMSMLSLRNLVPTGPFQSLVECTAPRCSFRPVPSD